MKWEDGCGNIFRSEDELYKDASENMTLADYAHFGDFSVEELLSIIFRNEIYDNKLEEKLCIARDNYIESYYTEIEEDEESEVE